MPQSCTGVGTCVLVDNGTITATPTLGSETLSVSTGPLFNLVSSALGADLKTWQLANDASGNFSLKACNDALSTCTNTIVATRGTTFAVSTVQIFTGVAGTGVAGFTMDSHQHVKLGNTVAPTIASGACGATTNGTILAGSNDHIGVVQIGAAATTTCTITFSSTWTTAPIACLISPSNAAAAAWATTVAFVNPANITTGQWVITGTALANANYSYRCS